jgi:hypothetical protein
MKKLFITLLILIFPAISFAFTAAEKLRMAIPAPRAAPSAAPTYVAHNSGYNGGPVTLTGVTGGHQLIVMVSGNSSTASTTLSGSCAVSWVALTVVIDAGGSNDSARFFYCSNASNGNASVTITGAPTDAGWAIHEFTAGSLDVETARADANANPSSGNVTATTNVMLVGFLADEATSAAPTATGWTAMAAQTDHYHWTFYKTATSGTQAFSVTRGAAGRAMLGVAALKGP